MHTFVLHFHLLIYIPWHGQTGVEPKRPRKEVADLYINLGATLEDHVEVRFIMCPLVIGTHSYQTGNERDITMRAGRQRGALPLIRKFNDHSERLLDSALWVHFSYTLNLLIFL